MNHYPPIGEAGGKAAQVEAMFDAIARRYDILNRLLSLGVDTYWRRQAVGRLEPLAPRRILDVATGTGDLALEAARRLEPELVVGVDISASMLARARKKVKRRHIACKLVFERADAAQLPFPDCHFDAVVVGFGVRNFENVRSCLAELCRVLVPCGQLVVLEFSRPEPFLVRQAYHAYSRGILPLVGRVLSRDGGAYRYLPDSIAAFPSGKGFLELMQKAGYAELSCRPLTFGVASLYRGQKPGESVSV